LETELAIVLIGFTALMLGPMIWDCCVNAGASPADMDLAVQAVKTYLISRHGLAGGDWDPHSYLGRPPLVNYPVVPFLLPALLSRCVDPALACSISEYVYRMLPVLVWAALRLAGADSRGSLGALIVYLVLYPIYLLHNATYVRVATTLAYCAFTTAVIVWYSNLGRRLRTATSAALLYVALLSNFIYILLPAAAFALLESRTLFPPILSATPVLYLAYEFGKLSFSNVPASCHFTYTILDKGTTMILGLLSGLAVLTLLISLLDSRSAVLSLGTGACLATLAGWCMVSPGLEKLMIGSAKVLTQLDLQRLPIIPSLTLTIGVARVSRKRSLPPTWALIGLPPVCLTAIGSAALPWVSLPSLIAGVYDGHEQRVFVAGTADALFPWKDGRLGMSLMGAFHQGLPEPALRVLTATYFPLGTMAGGFSDYSHRPGYNQPFSLELTRKLLDILPTGRVEVMVEPAALHGPCDVKGVPEVRSRVSLRDALPVDRVRVLYVGSFTDYSYLWLNVVRCAPAGYFPVIPCLRPYDLKHHQQLDVTRYWTGDVLVVDPGALQHPGLRRLVKRARIVVVAHSSPALDRADVKDVVRLVRKCGKRPIVLGPVHRPIAPRALRPLMRSLVHWDGCKVKGAVHLAANDRMVVDGVRSRLAVIPWAWAPFWAVNGREGEACPVGPYMLVRTGGKPAHLHYVAWERYQSRAYLCSALLFIGLTAAAVMLSSARSRLKGAVGLS